MNVVVPSFLPPHGHSFPGISEEEEEEWITAKEQERIEREEKIRDADLYPTPIGVVNTASDRNNASVRNYEEEDDDEDEEEDDDELGEDEDEDLQDFEGEIEPDDDTIQEEYRFAESDSSQMQAESSIDMSMADD
eukprot:TRINITY_DN11250_c0_g1_i1.p1 TRINITY_DN11250_c0_g1~~TRINITY_DN11250_c0_g1_i1.p1  ORF type:complete len:135 (-),score=61.46 TRINITY_DN11250_c0_g1_i1:55-459(-)